MAAHTFIGYRICAWCKQPLGTQEVSEAGGGSVTHGICPQCAQSIKESQPVPPPVPASANQVKAGGRSVGAIIQIIVSLFCLICYCAIFGLPLILWDLFTAASRRLSREQDKSYE